MGLNGKRLKRFYGRAKGFAKKSYGKAKRGYGYAKPKVKKAYGYSKRAGKKVYHGTRKAYWGAKQIHRDFTRKSRKRRKTTRKRYYKPHGKSRYVKVTRAVYYKK